LFTDGIDNASAGVANRASSPSELINNARAEKTAIYALGFGVGSYQRLSTICEFTGGEYHNATNDLIGSFQRLQTMTFSNFYIIKAKCSKIPESVVISNASGKKTVTVPIVTGDLVKPIPADPEYLPQFGAIKFNIGSDDINKKYGKTIDQLIQQMIPYLKANPNAKIEIRGHASPDGEETTNTLLSFKRARAAHTQICNAIEAKYPKDSDALNTMNQISFKGYGHKEPIYPVDSRNNPENRRVEIVLIK
jgi:outer membrane protein OmpA-like peptidoglycan-associated protein